MSSELVYTSVPSGLKPGSKGFCTVAMTAGLSTAWIDRLESLSPYRAVYPLGDPKSDRNPINFSHWRVNVAGKTRSVLSRVAFDGADYSGRSNKLAHHIVMEPAEQAEGGPAWMLLQSGLMRTKWSGAPSQIPTGPKLPAGNTPPRPCATWAAALGDAGWAGALAKSFMAEPAKPAYLVYTPGTDVLKLFEESLSLLPPAKRWEVTFSTFFTDLPLNLSCAWRAVVAGTPAALEASRLGPRALLIDVTKPAAAAPSDVYAQAARAGTGPVTVDTPITRPPAVPKKLVGATALLDPEDTHVEMVLEEDRPVVVAPEVKSRQKLTPLRSTGEHEELIGYGEIVNVQKNAKAQQQVIVWRGVRGWIFVVSIIGCLLLGVAGSGSAFYLARNDKGRSAGVDPMDAKIAEAQKAAALAEAGRIEANIAAEKANGEAKITAAALTALQKITDDQKAQIALLNAQLLDQKRLASIRSTAQTSAAANDNAPKKHVGWEPIRGLTAALPTAATQLSSTFQDKIVTLPFVSDDIDTVTLTWPDNSVQEFEYTSPGKPKVNLTFENKTEDSEKLLRVVARWKPPLADGDSIDYPVIIHLKGSQLSFDHKLAKSQAIVDQVNQILGQCAFVERDASKMPKASFYFKSNRDKLIFDSKACDLGQLPEGILLRSDLHDSIWTAQGTFTNSLVVSRNDGSDAKFTIHIEQTHEPNKRLVCDWLNSRKTDAETAGEYKYANTTVQNFVYTSPLKLSLEDEKFDPQLFAHMRSLATSMAEVKKKIDTCKGLGIDALNSRFSDLNADLTTDKAQFNKEVNAKYDILQKWQFPEFDIGVCLPNGVEMQPVHMKPESQ